MQSRLPFDTECYPNYWLLRLGPWYWQIGEQMALSAEQVAQIRYCFATYPVRSFNGLNYDVPMICAAIHGATCEQLKLLNDRIIVEKVKPWELGLPEWKPADHIDIMQVVPGDASLKTYGGVIHAPTMRDLPYEPSQRLTVEQMGEVFTYCGNDLALLDLLAEEIAPRIAMRETLGSRYGIDLRSKSDAQVAEAVIKHRCEQITGQRIFKTQIDPSLKFRFEMPSFIAFRSEQLQRLKTDIESTEFGLIKSIGKRGIETLKVDLPPSLNGRTVTIGGLAFALGIGGLHSRESKAAHVADEQYGIRDIDVASYYPTLIINSGKYPPAIGESFREVYISIKADRLEAKALAKKLPKGTPEQIEAATMDGGGKIMINGTFGKTLSTYGVLSAPQMGIQTTLSGQLSLLMLIEWLTDYGFRVISANTDGLVVYYRRDLLPVFEGLVKRWEIATGLEMEAAEYRAIYSRDVNNYVAIKPDGSTKRKGVYAEAHLEPTPKQPDCDVCSDAVAEFLSKGTPIEVSVMTCRDIRKFVTIRVVNGGAVKLWGEGPLKTPTAKQRADRLLACGWQPAGRSHWQHPEIFERVKSDEAYRSTFGPQRREYIGKVIRAYYSTQAPGTIVYESNGNTVGDSEGLKPCMVLPDTLPGDIDYARYIAMVESMLRDLGY